MVLLSARTRDHLRVLFTAPSVAEAERLLIEGCSENLPLVGDPTPLSLERVRFAVLRLSGGDLTRLAEAIRVAQTDWRDVLVAAGFGETSQAHTTWQPRRLDPAIVADWAAGSAVLGIAFALGESVEVTWGPAVGQVGTVVGIASLEPQARYLVSITPDTRDEVYESSLRRAG